MSLSKSSLSMSRDVAGKVADSVHLISHTHWDREFYLSFQRFRYRLVHVINELLDYLPDHPEFRYYHLDGQTSVIEDYLEVEEDRKDELFAHIKAGRILIGPWYVLADQFKVSGEATIRNLLIGDQQSREYGGKMNIGYLPDLFGHMGQMPQILRGFGMNEAIIWRGISDRGDELLPSEWIWEGSDGSRVLAFHLPDRHGYTNGFTLPYDPQGLKDKLDQLYLELKTYANTSHMLVMNGMDHQSAHLPIPGMFDQLNRESESPSYEVVHGSLLEYVKQVKAELELHETELPVYKGEFRFTNHGRTAIFNFVVPGVLSSRIHLSQWNERMQTLLERWSEPFAVMALWQGRTYPRTLLRKAWKYLLQNHPHDSICGTSTDDAPRQMITRFEWVQDIAEQALLESLYHLSGSVELVGGRPDSRIISVYNPLQYEVSEAIEMEVAFPEELEFRDVQLVDDTNTEIPVKLLSIEKKLDDRNVMKYWPPDVIGIRKMARIVFKAEAIPAFGSRSYRLAAMKKKPNRQWVRFSEALAVPAMENEHLAVYFHPNGSFDLLDKASGKRYPHLHIFEDGADIGDTYTYSECRNDRIFSTYGEQASIRLLEQSRIRTVYEVKIAWQLPARYKHGKQERSAETVECELVSRISLVAGSRRVDVETRFYNRAEDHRLRVLFPTHLNADAADALGSFEVVRRPIQVQQPEREVWLEDEPVTFPQQGFVDLSDGRHGLALIAPGLLEYEVMNTAERSIALTLLRSVGYLAAGDRPLTILHGAAPHLETPDAQCRGWQHYRYSLYPHTGNWRQGQVLEQSQRFIAGLRPFAYPESEANEPLPAAQSMLSINNQEIVVSALKQCEHRDGTILRVYNPTAQSQKAQIAVRINADAAYATDLKETRLAELPLTRSERAGDMWTHVDIELGPGKLFSLEWEIIKK